MIKIKRLLDEDFIWCSLIFLASLIIIRPLFYPGFYPFHDEPQIANLYQMVRALSSGQIPPRWAPDVSFNYGYPLFNFYYPLPFYLGSFFHFFFGISLIWSLKLLFILSVPISGLVFFLLMRKYFSRSSSFFGAIVYLFTPYRAVNLYVRGALGELWSFVFMPLVLLTLINLTEKRSCKNFVFFAFSVGGLILNHNLTAIIFLPIVVIFALVIIGQKKEKISTFLVIMAAFLFGLSISFYYWFPAIAEKKFVQAGTPFNPFDHFPFLKQLVIPSWGYGASLWGPNDGMSFQIGITNLLVVLIAITFFLLGKRLKIRQDNSVIYLNIGIFFVSIFFMNIRSGFLWKILPLGSYIQFPWRFLMLTSFSSSFLIGLISDLLVGRKGVTLSVLLALSAVFLTAGYFKPEKQFFVDDDYYLLRFFANRTSKGESQKLSEEYLNYSEDYLPLTIWTMKKPTSLPEKKLEINEGKISYRSLSSIDYEAEVITSEPGEVIFHSYYFPGWTATVNDRKVPIGINPPYGDSLIPVPAGKSSIKIKFSESKIRYFADLVSLFSSIVLLAFLVLKKRFCFFR